MISTTRPRTLTPQRGPAAQWQRAVASSHSACRTAGPLVTRSREVQAPHHTWESVLRTWLNPEGNRGPVVATGSRARKHNRTAAVAPRAHSSATVPSRSGRSSGEMIASTTPRAGEIPTVRGWSPRGAPQSWGRRVPDAIARCSSMATAWLTPMIPTCTAGQANVESTAQSSRESRCRHPRCRAGKRHRR